MRRVGLCLNVASVVLLGLLAPVAASAQGDRASIVGVAQDSSGAMLPGVSVEAASPALISGSRAVVTDGSGRYAVVDLRPGVYTVTFTLPGFNTVKREGIVLGTRRPTTTSAMRCSCRSGRPRPWSSSAKPLVWRQATMSSA